MITTYKLDDFLQRKYKKILIFGIAGAGKTTLGRKLSEISGIEFNDFDDFFYQNSELKIQNYSEYIAKRKIFENDLFFSHRTSLVAGLGPILRNDNSQKIYDFPAICIERHLLIANIQGIKRNIGNIIKGKIPKRHIFNELLFVPKSNLTFKNALIEVKEKFAQNSQEKIKVFKNEKELIAYFVEFL